MGIDFASRKPGARLRGTSLARHLGIAGFLVLGTSCAAESSSPAREADVSSSEERDGKEVVVAPDSTLAAEMEAFAAAYNAHDLKTLCDAEAVGYEESQRSEVAKLRHDCAYYYGVYWRSCPQFKLTGEPVVKENSKSFHVAAWGSPRGTMEGHFEADHLEAHFIVHGDGQYEWKLDFNQSVCT